jgi:hypothetical protein
MPMLPYGVETLGTLINHPTPFTGFVSRDHRQKRAWFSEAVRAIT